MSIHNQGSGFEDSLARVCEVYKLKGILELEKVEPPVRVVGTGFKRKVIFMPNPFLDYVGAWRSRGGRALFLEAKSTREPKLPFGAGGLTDKQIDALERWHSAGAAVGLLWEHLGHVRFVPLMAIQAQRDSSTRHLKWGNATPVPAGMGFLFWDFEPVLARYYPD